MNAYETQLLFAHCQKHLVAASNTTPAKTIRTASRALAELADIFNMPITFAFVPDDKGEASPIPELEDYLTDGNNFLRLAATPFLDEAFAQSLDAHGRKNLIIAGYATEVVILKTTLDAIAAGYMVYVPVDAVGGMTERTEQAVFDQIRAAGGIVTSAYSLVALLAPDFGHGAGIDAYRVAQALQQ